MFSSKYGKCQDGSISATPSAEMNKVEITFAMRCSPRWAGRGATLPQASKRRDPSAGARQGCERERSERSDGVAVAGGRGPFEPAVLVLEHPPAAGGLGPMRLPGERSKVVDPGLAGRAAARVVVRDRVIQVESAGRLRPVGEHVHRRPHRHCGLDLDHTIPY